MLCKTNDTSPTTLCSRRVLQHAKLACRRRVNAVRAQHGELACVPEPEVRYCWRLVQTEKIYRVRQKFLPPPYAVL